MESCRESLQDEGTCSICRNYSTDEVTLNCGHNICLTCIARNANPSSPRFTCPLCCEEDEARKMRPKPAHVVQIVKDFSNLLKWILPKWIRVDPDQERKDQICLSLKTLRKKRGKFLEYKAENQKETQDLLKQMEAERVKTAIVFGQLHQFLEEQENLLQTQMEEVEKEIERQGDEYQATVSAKLSNLESLIQELEEKLQQSASEPLQNVESILERCKKKWFKCPVAFPAALKWRIHDFSDINPFLESIMKQFQESLVSGLPLQKDPDTAHPKLVLSEDRKNVREGSSMQDLPQNPERFEHWRFVLGHEGFSSGRHFWEIAVGSEEVWSVGVAKKSVERKRPLNNPMGDIWDMGMWNGEYRLPGTGPPLILSQELNKVRVTLNCAAGRVAFFNADTGEQVYVYSDESFCGETILPIFYVDSEGCLTICP